MKDLAMQTRCIHCKKEQYSPAVFSLSKKGGDCPWCDKEIKPMNYKDYLKALKEGKG